MNSILIFKLAIIGHYFTFCFGVLRPPTNDWTLRILHTNDMRARFEQTSVHSTECNSEDAKAGKCYGGFARLATAVQQARNQTDTPVIFLNAGNTFGETLWYSIYKWEIVAPFLSFLKPDVISLGDHEFDDYGDTNNLIKFLNEIDIPAVAANLNISNETHSTLSRKLKKSHILDVEDHKIGVIGYLTPETKNISASGNEYEFLDEIQSVREEVEKLQKQGITIFIALGSSGFEVDQRIAAEVEGLDLVIGGHSKTFLYTGNQPDLEIPEGSYPTVVTQKNGRKVYVVQAYAYTKYLGNLTINFNDEGEIKNIHGNPILMDNNIAEDQNILHQLDNFREAVDRAKNEFLGKLYVSLDGNRDSCRVGKCNMGNLIVDALIDYNVRSTWVKNGWTDAAIAFFNSGSIWASINKTQYEDITVGDVWTVLPFSDRVVKKVVSGKIIREILEHSGSGYNINDKNNLGDIFLQFSGLEVVYDVSHPSGSRVVSVFVRCAEYQIPHFEPLETNKSYKILMPSSIASGGYGYTMLKDLPSEGIDVSVETAVSKYIEAHNPVYTGIDNRIRVLSSSGRQQDAALAMIIFSILIFLRDKLFQWIY